MRKLRTGALIALTVLGTPLAMAAPAQAAVAPNQVWVSGDTITAVFTDTETSSFIDIDEDAGEIVVRNRYGWLTAGDGCRQSDGHSARCKTQGVTSIGVAAGPGDDYVTKTATLPAVINGGAGDDQIRGGKAVGGAGRNYLIGDAGADYLFGGPNGDLLDGGAGADSLHTEGGFSTVSYRSRTAPVTAEIGGFGGEAGEKDSISGDIYEVEGGSGNDRLTISQYSRAMHTLRGGAGDDTLVGGSADDCVLIGGPGDDTLDAHYGVWTTDEYHGGEGRDLVTYEGRGWDLNLSLDNIANDGTIANDGGSVEEDNIFSDVEDVTGGSAADIITGDADANTLRGSIGDDVIRGGGGDDTIDGFLDNDTIDGGDGDDTILSYQYSDGSDTISGGNGTDSMSYAGRGWDVSVTLDGVANDGQIAGQGPEKDNVGTDVEAVIGGYANDSLSGSTSANVLDGGQGNDRIDAVDGIAANDRIYGGDGTDTCKADAGDQKVYCEN